jgi:hypothetical protein
VKGLKFMDHLNWRFPVVTSDKETILLYGQHSQCRRSILEGKFSGILLTTESEGEGSFV